MQIPMLSNRLLTLRSIPVRFLPFGFPLLHLLFGDGERLANGVVEPFGFCVAGSDRVFALRTNAK